MNFYTAASYGPFTRRYEVPEHYEQYRVPGARPLYVKGKFGDYLTQKIRCNGLSIQLNIFGIVIKALVYPYSPMPVIPLHYMLQNSISCMLDEFGEAWLIEKCVHLFYIPGKAYQKAWLEPGFYRSFHIDFSPGTFSRLAAGYSELDDVRSRFERGSRACVQLHTSYITPAVQKIINEILFDRPATDPALGVFTEIKSKELLLKYLQHTAADTGPAAATGKTLVEQVTGFMETHLDYPFTVRILAAMFTTNETTLKRLFKRYTGQTIAVFLTRKRMERAIYLLQHDDLLIGSIALQVGYNDFSSFDRAFYRYTGHNPAFYRGKRR